MMTIFYQFTNIKYVCVNVCLAEDEFQELCFEFGLELDEVVSRTL